MTLTGLDYRGNPVTLTAPTNPDGTYSILDAPPSGPAGYQLTSNQPSGYGPPGPTARTIHLTSGTDVLHQDFALPTGTIRGVVYQDLNLDGVQEVGQGESGLSGVTVALTGVDVNGKQVTATAVTAADGTFSFTGLLAGTYSLHETQPAGYYNGLNHVGTAGGVLGDAGQRRDRRHPARRRGDRHRLRVRRVQTGFDLRNVFLDANDDGSFDQGDSGIAGAQVTLSGVAYAGTSLARPITNADVSGGLVQTTDAAGHWEYDLLPPGVYTVAETPPAGYLDGALENADPHGAGVVIGDHRFSSVAVDPVAMRGDLNFGQLLPASVSGVVYIDGNDNGRLDPGEAGLGGVAVTLIGVDDHGQAVLLTATTAADGTFDFTNLRPGAYQLLEGQPATYVAGASRAGSLGGLPGQDAITDLVLSEGARAADYLFAQTRPFAGTGLSPAPMPYFPAARDAVFGGIPGPAGANVPTTLTASPFTADGGGSSFDTEDALAKLSGYVYHDRNDNGLFEQDDEDGIAGVAVTLNGVSNRGQAADRTVLTDAFGFYEFDHLPPGTYQVNEQRPAGWLDGSDSVGTVNGAATGALADKGELVRVGLPKGGEGRDYDFGELAPAALEGSVLSWQQDVDGNSFLEALSDVPVHLTGVDDRGATVRLEARTAHDGSYRFRGLRPGTYTVQPADPRGSLPVKANVGSAGGKEEDPRRVAEVRLKSGECGKAYDFEVEAALRVQGGGSGLDPRRGQCVLPAGIHEEAGAGRTANPAETSGLAVGIGVGVVALRQEVEAADKCSRRVKKPTNG